jgi:uncharacterized membrane protein (DUF2068 family)
MVLLDRLGLVEGERTRRVEGDHHAVLWRTFRAVVLIVVGLVLVTHPHTDWGRTITDAAHNLGLNPNSNGIQRILAKLHAISARRYFFFGVVAIGYGVVEGVEGYGLFRRKPWAEWLTVIATSLLFIPEVWEISQRPTLLKAGALIVNIVVVIYLLRRLRR